MPPLRTFIGVDPSPGVRRKLMELSRELSAAGADVRWVREGGLHCTLKFLGAVEPARLEQVQLALRRELASVAEFVAEARGLGVFPSWREPRIVWVGLDAEELPALAAHVESALVPLGFAPEKRAFRPHITLARVRGRRGWKQLEERLRAHAAAEFGASPVVSVVVYRSDLRPGGSVYTPLCTIPFRG
jgi:2'-5' RNA ligase